MDPATATDSPAPGWTTLSTQALGWLMLGNAVGLILALLLLVPVWNADLAPFTYGRWVPVHLDIQLYGWSSLPLVGLLFRALLPARGWDSAARWMTISWSAVLAFGCASWLAGWTSAKPFVEWAGPARGAYAALLFALALMLGAGYVVRRRGQDEGRLADALKGVLLCALLAVPALIYLAARPGVYPAVNPDSGGATGGSLLGSTLGIIAIFLAAPRLAGCAARGGRRGDLLYWGLWALHALAFALLRHGDRSHHEPAQIIGLSSLVLWVPVLRLHLRRFAWPEEARPWLAAMLAWGAALVLSASIAFLPGLLERWKFTHALVAHSHLAMAGLVTSFNMVLLVALSPAGRTRAGLYHPLPFAAWQGGLLIHLLSLVALGELEALSPGILFGANKAADTLMALRLLSGLVMFAASVSWWRASLPHPLESPA